MYKTLSFWELCYQPVSQFATTHAGHLCSNMVGSRGRFPRQLICSCTNCFGVKVGSILIGIRNQAVQSDRQLTKSGDYTNDRVVSEMGIFRQQSKAGVIYLAGLHSNALLVSSPTGVHLA